MLIKRLLFLIPSLCFLGTLSCPEAYAKLDKAIKIKEDCGETLLTQWEADFKAKTLSFVRKNKFPDYFCEPLPAGDASQAQVLFLNDKKEVLWTRRIQFSRISNFDKPVDSAGNLSGGWFEKEKIVVQLKIPDNDFTAQVRWVQIQTEDSLNLGPSPLK